MAPEGRRGPAVGIRQRRSALNVGGVPTPVPPRRAFPATRPPRTPSPSMASRPSLPLALATLTAVVAVTLAALEARGVLSRAHATALAKAARAGENILVCGPAGDAPDGARVQQQK